MRLGKKLRVLRASGPLTTKPVHCCGKEGRDGKKKGEGGGEGEKGEEEERGGGRKNTVFEALASLLKFWLGTVIILN